MAILALAALAPEARGVMERTKERGVAVNVNQMVRADVAGSQRKKTGRIDLALTGDENDAVTVANFKSPVDGATLDFLHAAAGISHAVERHAPERRRFCCLDSKRSRLGEIEQQFQTLLTLFPSERFERFAAPGGNQKEKAPASNS